ncbi:PBECR4 domain-containing protein, partial [Ursidibacter sp. B-7004-1]
DKALRTKTRVFTLTLINDDHLFIPQSLLNLRTMNNFPKGDKIIGIKSVHLEDKTEIIYL